MEAKPVKGKLEGENEYTDAPAPAPAPAGGMEGVIRGTRK